MTMNASAWLSVLVPIGLALAGAAIKTLVEMGRIATRVDTIDARLERIENRLDSSPAE